MVKITYLSEKEIDEIGEAFADFEYDGSEQGMTFLWNGRENIKKYICGYARAMIKAGMLYSTSDKHEAYVAFSHSGDKMNLSGAMELVKAFVGTLGVAGCISAVKKMNSAGRSYHDMLKKSKQEFIYIPMLAVTKKYQGQGFMRKVIEIPFEVGRKRNCQVVLETDAVLKRDKYMHLGMELAATRRISENSVLYDLVKYYGK